MMIYVRYIDGVIMCVPDTNEQLNYLDDNREFINKTSSDLISIIELGDYVNGYKVVEIDEYEPIAEPKQKYLKLDCSRLFNAIYTEDIKTVVTKEQFDSCIFKNNGVKNVKNLS